MTALPPTKSGLSPLERRVLAVGTAIVLHAVVIGLAAVIEALVQAASPLPAFPKQPLLISAVALLLAHCSIGALWWARSQWPSHAKTLVAVLAAGFLWLLLVAALESASLTETAAAGWALCIATQTLLTALGAAVLEIELSPKLAANRSRFTILFLLLWMAVVGVLLGAGRSIATALHWTWADLRAWEYLYQLQTLAVSNAVLAVGLVASIRVPRDALVRELAAVLTLLAVAIALPAFMFALFSKVGAGFADMFWLVLFQSLFLLATLVPLEAIAPPARN